MTDEQFIEKYEELLDKGYCDCNEMNCIDNNSPRRILNIVKGTKLEAKQLLEENKYLKDKLRTTKEVAVEHLKKEIELKQQLKVKKDQNKKLKSLICMSIKLNKKIINMRKDGYSYEQIKPYLLKQYDVLKKYKEIVGDNNE